MSASVSLRPLCKVWGCEQERESVREFSHREGDSY